MKETRISDLIAELEAIKARHGDIPCYATEEDREAMKRWTNCPVHAHAHYGRHVRFIGDVDPNDAGADIQPD